MTTPLFTMPREALPVAQRQESIHELVQIALQAGLISYPTPEQIAKSDAEIRAVERSKKNHAREVRNAKLAVQRAAKIDYRNRNREAVNQSQRARYAATYSKSRLAKMDKMNQMKTILKFLKAALKEWLRVKQDYPHPKTK